MRPRKCRKVCLDPTVTVFKPAGVPMRVLETVHLDLDELEALRLADKEGCYHEDAGARMGVSRATFGRLLEGARRKIATALVEGSSIVIRLGAESVERREWDSGD